MLSGSPCSFYILSLKSLTNFFTNISSIIITKYIIFDSLLYTTRIVSFPVIGSNCYNQYLEDAIWRRVKNNDDTISHAEVVSVSTSCSRCSNLTFFSCSMTHFPHGLYSDFSWPICIYSINTILYPYTLPLELIPLLISSLCLSATWALWVKVITATW